MGGAFERADKMGNKDPFKLPQSWLDAKKAGTLKLDTPFNFASTADIIGGNSGCGGVGPSTAIYAFRLP